ISPEKGTQLGFIAQGLMLVVSGVYYPVSVLPEWMQWIAQISPATHALRGIRAGILEGTSAQWADVWPLLVIGAVSVPLGLFTFRTGERYAKQHGKRNGPGSPAAHAPRPPSRAARRSATRPSGPTDHGRRHRVGAWRVPR